MHSPPEIVRFLLCKNDLLLKVKDVFLSGLINLYFNKTMCPRTLYDYSFICVDHVIFLYC